MALSRLFSRECIRQSQRCLLPLTSVRAQLPPPLSYAASSYLPASTFCDLTGHSSLKFNKSGQVPVCGKRRMGKLASSLVEGTPSTVQPYLKLMRLDKPIGSWLLFWPCAWSIGLAAAPGSFPDLYLISLCGIGAIIMRGAGCIVNDLIDRDIDTKVERTKIRPLASGELTPTNAIALLCGCLSGGLLVLLQFNWYCILLGASSLSLVFTYPLAKRYLNWPQLTLGLVFNWGALFGWAAVHGACNFSVCLPLYLGCMSWTLVYDTIYAFQDKKDDIRIGVKSTALSWDKNAKKYLLSFTGLMAACLTTTGLMCEQTLPYYLSVGLGTSFLGYRCAILDTDDASQCNRLFVLNSLLGFIIMTGIILGNFKKSSTDKSFSEQAVTQ